MKQTFITHQLSTSNTRTMNKIALLVACVLLAGCVSAQLTPLQGGLLSAVALPFILNGGQFSSGQGILPPPIYPGYPGAVHPGPVIIHRRYYKGGYGHGKY